MRLRIREYLTADGRSPYRTWLDTRDPLMKARVQARVLRFEMGNLGDHKSLGVGAWKRACRSVQYRIYFGKVGRSLIILLGGGGKKSQSQDIRRAQQSWADHSEATPHGKTQQGLE